MDGEKAIGEEKPERGGAREKERDRDRGGEGWEGHEKCLKINDQFMCKGDTSM